MAGACCTSIYATSSSWLSDDISFQTTYIIDHGMSHTDAGENAERAIRVEMARLKHRMRRSRNTLDETFLIELGRILRHDAVRLSCAI